MPKDAQRIHKNKHLLENTVPSGSVPGLGFHWYVWCPKNRYQKNPNLKNFDGENDEQPMDGMGYPRLSSQYWGFYEFPRWFRFDTSVRIFYANRSSWEILILPLRIMAKTSLRLNVFLACNSGSVPLAIFGSVRAIFFADLTLERMVVGTGNHPQSGRTNLVRLLLHTLRHCWKWVLAKLIGTTNQLLLVGNGDLLDDKHTNMGHGPTNRARKLGNLRISRNPVVCDVPIEHGINWGLSRQSSVSTNKPTRTIKNGNPVMMAQNSWKPKMDVFRTVFCPVGVAITGSLKPYSSSFSY